MSLKTRLELFAPRLSHLGSAAKQKIKSLHPKKVLMKNLGLMVQGAKLVMYHMKKAGRFVADSVPRIQISTRRAMQVKTERLIYNKRLSASSKQGILINDSYVRLLNGKPGFHTELRTYKNYKDDEESACYLVKVDPAALKESDKQFEEALEQFATKKMAVARCKNGVPEALQSELSAAKSKLDQIREENTHLRALASQLVLKQAGEQHGSKAALKDALRFSRTTDVFRRLNTSELAEGVVETSRSRLEEEQRIHEDIKANSSRLQHAMYPDVMKYVESKSFDDLKKRQSNRQIIWGTDKLRMVTGELKYLGRMPGLDYYVCVANSQNQTKGIKEEGNDLLKHAIALMVSDLAMFEAPVEKWKLKICNTQEKTFDAGRLSTYHHLCAFEETMNQLKGYLNGSQDISQLMATDGEEIGFGRHPGNTPDALTPTVKARYPAMRNLELMSDKLGMEREEIAIPKKKGDPPVELLIDAPIPEND